MLPNFLVIGAAKCATTSLCHLLGRHPQVFMARPKELNFFSDDDLYARGASCYSSFFEAAAGRRAVGEGSVRYTSPLWPGACERIAKDLPGARLIYIVRHPLERIESLWLQWHRAGLEPLPFGEAVRRRSSPLLLATRYWRQIGAYRRHFRDEAILVLFFEDFRRDPDSVLRRCFEFLGVDPEVRIPGSRIPLNTAAAMWSFAWLFRHWSRHRWLDGLDRRVPEPLRAALRAWARARFPGRPAWDGATRAHAVEQLAEESRRFLRHYGKPEDFWRFEAAPQT